MRYVDKKSILGIVLLICLITKFAFASEKYTAYLSLIDEDGTTMPFACSAAIVDKHLLLTAGHCFDEERKKAVLPKTALFYKNGNFVEEIAVTDFEVYSEFKSGESHFKDIAWVKLKEEIPAAFTTLLVHEKLRDSAHKPLSSYGFARQIGQRTGGMTMAPDDEQLLLNGFSHDKLAKYILLARLEPLPRPGDSGGPVLMESYGQTVLVGVVQQEGALYSKNLAVVVTRIAPFIDWIEKSSGIMLKKVS